MLLFCYSCEVSIFIYTTKIEYILFLSIDILTLYIYIYIYLFVIDNATKLQ